MITTRRCLIPQKSSDFDGVVVFAITGKVMGVEIELLPDDEQIVVRFLVWRAVGGSSSGADNDDRAVVNGLQRREYS
jgi:hypothetical protein